MAEYIKRETAVRAVMAAKWVDGSDGAMAMEIVASPPAADVAPVLYGRWGTGRFNLETGNYEKQCTRCRNFSKEYGKLYCPNCGAKMDGGADHV
jgi:hypothetical protein